MADRRRNRKRRNRAVATVVSLGGAAVIARQVATNRAWATGDDPCGPDGLALPDGETRSVTVDDGAELAVSLAGPDDGPVVVLAHCWTGSRAVWAPTARRLALAGHRVVLYDQRGHGASTFGGGRTDVERLGEDLRAILEQLDLRDAVLAGHSMGGMTIQALAKDHPDVVRERVRAVTLVATAAKVTSRPVPAAAVEAVLGERALGAWFRGPAGIQMCRGALGSVAHRAHVTATRDLFIDTNPAARTGFLVGMSAMDLRAGHANIEVPTTIIVGSHDRLTPPRLAKVMATGIATSELVVVPKAGHMLPLEVPDQVAHVITRHTAIGRAAEQPAAS